MRDQTMLVFVSEKPAPDYLTGDEVSFEISGPTSSTKYAIIEKICEAEKYEFHPTLAREIAVNAESPSELRGEIVRRMTPKFISEFAHKNNLFAHKGNHFPLVAALAYKTIFKEGGTVYFYGPPGVGATSLLNAIHKSSELSDSEIYHKQGFEFYEEFIDSMRRGTISEFRERVTSKKLVLIDDIDVCISGRESTSEEIGHLIYRAVDNGNHIFLTGRTPLKEISGNQRYLEAVVASYGFEMPIDLPVVKDRIRYVFDRCQTIRERQYIEDLIDQLEFTAINFNELNLLLLKAALSEGRGT